MKKNERQNTVLHDTYFNNPPSLIRLFLIRLVLLCGLSASAIYATGELFIMKNGLAEAAITAALASGAVFVLASLFPSGIVYLLSMGGFSALLLNEDIQERLTYFFDYLMIRLDSRLLKTAGFVINKEASSLQLEESCVFGLSLVGAFIGFLFAVCCRTRFHSFYILLIFSAFAAPAFAAEIAGYHPSITIFAAFFFAFFAIRMGYELEGKFFTGKEETPPDHTKRSERTYRRRRGGAILGRKLSGDIPRYMKYSPNAVIAFIVTIATALTVGHTVPEGTTFDYEKLFVQAQEMGADFVSRIEEEWGIDFGASSAENEYFSYSDYGDNSGGIGISKPSDGAAPVLDVVLGRNDIPVYLKGDIGVDFTGSSWTSIKDKYDTVPLWEQVSSFYPESIYQDARLYASRAGYDPDDFLPLQKVSVTYRKRTSVTFQPLAVYEPDYKSSQYFDSFGDYILRTKSGVNYLNTVENLALTPRMDFGGLGSLLSSLIYGGASGGNNAEAYNDYVRSMYFSPGNEDIAPLIDTLYDMGYVEDWMFSTDKANGICDYFRQNFSYSLSVDNGEGDEVIGNFLYRTKQGHCALFATAAVLALRELGVPARYVTGYVVAGDGEAVEGGYKYTLREKDLHAWVEVYVDNIGWLPYDPTAAVDGFDGMASESAHNNSEQPSVTEETTTTTTAEIVTSEIDEGEEDPLLTEGTDTTTKPPVSADGTGTGGEGGGISGPPAEDASFVPVLVTILCVAAAIVLVVITVRLFIKKLENAEKKVWRGFRKKPPYRACQEMYKLVMLILEKEGLVPGCELMNDFAERVDSSIFLKGTNVFLVDVMPVFIKCEFGTADLAPVSEEERAAVFKFTAAVYRKYMENKNSAGRFITRILLFL